MRPAAWWWLVLATACAGGTDGTDDTDDTDETDVEDTDDTDVEDTDDTDVEDTDETDVVDYAALLEGTWRNEQSVGDDVGFIQFAFELDGDVTVSSGKVYDEAAENYAGCTEATVAPGTFVAGPTTDAAYDGEWTFTLPSGTDSRTDCIDVADESSNPTSAPKLAQILGSIGERKFRVDGTTLYVEGAADDVEMTKQ